MTDMGTSDLRWRKSTRSGNNGQCVEVAATPDAILVRDSKDPDGPRLTFSRDQWTAFVESTKASEFDL
jgi:hypothetical protein